MKVEGGLAGTPTLLPGQVGLGDSTPPLMLRESRHSKTQMLLPVASLRVHEGGHW